jgi:hypothetical protein
MVHALPGPKSFPSQPTFPDCISISQLFAIFSV